jgi:chromosomal replication initiation ATPase DnaA
MAKLDPRFTFENFVVGPANRLASAAARRAAERPGVSYNPLFIHAPPGLGKTHVLGAIAHHVERIYPDKKVEFQTAQEFLREFVLASVRWAGVRDKEAVRDRYRELDILLLDDVQFLTGQADVQDLILLLLDTLTGDGKQVVLTSDRPPAGIDELGAHLRTRFEGGLLVDIGPPEYETRVAIVKKWIEIRLQLLEPGVADAIGRFPVETVTELEGALDRILETQLREDRTVSPEEATALLERGGPTDSDLKDSELGQFLNELSDTVAAKVQAQEAPWRRILRELVEEAEAEEFNADRLRRLIEEETQPGDLDGMLRGFRGAIRRLKEIRTHLEAAGNPWPEAAHGVLRDPERLDEAEALLASAEERARPFPEIPPGPTLEELGGELPRLVIRAADQLVTTDRPEYNPLYVWSSDGVAARALLQAAGRSKFQGEEGLRVALISVPRFAEEFIQALSSGVAGAWRERWWFADLLLVDGAQDLSATERAQEELFHLFEALQRRRARVMIAADRPPTQISALDDRLRARLEGGLVVEVEVTASDLSPELQETLQKPVPPPEPPKPERKDTSAEDRDWIRSFQPRVPLGPEASGGEEASATIEAWIPSPEKVIWEWPRLEERIVEELD